MSLLKELKSLSKHTAIYGLSNVLSKLTGFLLIPFYTHYLSPADYGLLELLFFSTQFIGILLGRGLTSSIARVFAAQKNTEEKKQLISSAIIFWAALASVLIVIGCFIGKPISLLIFSHPDHASLIRISLTTVFLGLLIEVTQAYLNAEQRSLAAVTNSWLRLIFSLALNIYFVAYLKTGVAGILYSGLISAIFFSLYLSIWILRQTGIHFNWAMQRDALKFSVPLMLNDLGMFFIHFGDRFFLQKVSSLHEIGIYSLGYRFGMLSIAFLIQQPFFMIWNVRQYDLIKQPNGAKIYSDIFFLYALLMSFVWLGLSLFAKAIIGVAADPSYNEAWKFIPIIAMAYVLRGFYDFYHGIFMIERKTTRIATTTISGALVCAASYFVLIPFFGTMGAALATLVTFLFMAVIMLWACQKERKINYHSFKVVVMLVVVTVLWQIGIYLAPSGMGSTIAFNFMLLALFGIIAFFCLMEKEHRQKLYGLLNQHIFQHSS